MSKNMSIKKQSGFTLIELVIVVVILGFLAVTAIPKFLDLTDQAKGANIEGMAGGFATAVSLVRSQWESEGRPRNGTINTVDYDGTILVLTSEVAASGAIGAIRPGYVVSSQTNAVTGNEDLTTFDAADCVDIWQNIYQQPPGVSSVITELDTDPSIDYFASKSGTGNEVLCHFYLKESLSKNTAGNYEAPTDGDTVTANTVGNSFTYQPAFSAIKIYINN